MDKEYKIDKTADFFFQEEMHELYLLSSEAVKDWEKFRKYRQKVLAFYKFRTPPKIKEKLKEDYAKVLNLKVNEKNSNPFKRDIERFTIALESVLNFHEKLIEELWNEGFVFKPQRVIPGSTHRRIKERYEQSIRTN